MSDRLTLCLPIDMARQFDSTVTQTQLTNNIFQGSADDRDVLASFIEDAEDEFRQLADADLRIGRVGVAGQRETYETLTYDVSGHEAYKRNWSGVAGNYRQTEVTKNLDNGRVLPFDSAEGDEAYVYRGLGGTASGDEWDDVTDEYGDTWAIVDHGAGTVVIHPLEIAKAMLPHGHGIRLHGDRLREFRMAISYRFGALGGSRGKPTQTNLAENITDTQTGTVSVSDGSGFPVGAGSGSIIVLIGREYVEVEPDPSNDQMNVVTRGVRGTDGASHSNGDRVQYTPPAIRKAVAARSMMTLLQSSRYRAWLPDSEDSVSKSDMMDAAEEVWESTIAAMR